MGEILTKISALLDIWYFLCLTGACFLENLLCFSLLLSPNLAFDISVLHYELRGLVNFHITVIMRRGGTNCLLACQNYYLGHAGDGSLTSECCCVTK